MNPIWTTRLVLPDNTVIMPGQMIAIYPKTKTIDIQTPDGNDWMARDIRKARHDRCTFLPDKNGKMIYENDRVKHKWESIEPLEGIVKQDHTGRWIVRTRAMDVVLSDQREYWEVTGHVPYGEELSCSNPL
jgi:hypothetical protein